MIESQLATKKLPSLFMETLAKCY